MSAGIISVKRKYLSGKFRKKIWLLFDKKCCLCGCETKLFGNTYGHFGEHRPCAVDHIKPFSKGGKCEDDNFQLLCIRCNSSKGAKWTATA